MWVPKPVAASVISRHGPGVVMWREGAPCYTPPASMGSSFETEPGRLNGWKEIALHLGKGTRSVQRWEKVYGLPVHRIGREGGEIVYAFRDEIDRWMASTERERAASGEGSPEAEAGGAPSGPRAPQAGEQEPPARARPRWALAAVLLGLAAVALGALSVLRRPVERLNGAADGGRQPAAWRLENESLTVFDATGALVFEHRFGFPLVGSSSSASPYPAVGPSGVLIADIDGDARSEVLVNVNARERANKRLYCFDADGRLRFVHQPTGTRRFGDDEYAEPWLAYRVFLTRGPDGGRRLWAVFTHNLLFPAVLQELSPRDGAVRQEYWSDGYIEVVHEESWAGRPVVLVGGANNDFRAASLAVFSPDAVSGSAPAARPGYVCHDCPAGGPRDFFLFPSLCIARRHGQAGLMEAWVEHGDRIRVTLAQGERTSGGATLLHAGTRRRGAERRDLPRVPGGSRAPRAAGDPRPPVRRAGRRRHVPGAPVGRPPLRGAVPGEGRPLKGRPPL